MYISLTVGPKGQIVIPKVVRESLGILENKQVILQVTDKKIEITPFDADNFISMLEKRVKEMKVNVERDWVTGDALFEEEYA